MTTNGFPQRPTTVGQVVAIYVADVRMRVATGHLSAQSLERAERYLGDFVRMFGRQPLSHCRKQDLTRFLDAHPDWLTVVRLPAYASDLNPTEGAWSHLKRDLGNLVTCTVDQLAATVKTLLKRIQSRPELIDGFLAQTGLTLKPQPP